MAHIRPLAEVLERYWDYHAQTVSRIAGGTMAQVLEILDSPWLQAVVGGEKRLFKMMRMSDTVRGTVLHAAIRTRDMERITEVLSADRGGGQAFLIYKNDATRDTPLHTAAKVIPATEVQKVQFLLDNGGGDARRVRNALGRFPMDVAHTRTVSDALFFNRDAVGFAEIPAVAPLDPRNIPAGEPDPVAVPPAEPAPVVPPVVPPAEPVAPPAEPVAVVPPAEPDGLAPLPPEMPWIPIQGNDNQVRAAYQQRFNSILPTLGQGAPLELLVEELNEPWLQQVDNAGVRRVAKLMTFTTDGRTLLHRGFLRGATREQIQELLRRGARDAFFIRDDNGSFPLHLAAVSYEDPEIIRFLLENGGSEAVRLGTVPDQRLPSEIAVGNNSPAQIVQVFREAEEARLGQEQRGEVQPAQERVRFVPQREEAMAPAVPVDPFAIPPPIPFVPFANVQESRAFYNQEYNNILNAASDPDVTLEQFLQVINKPKLQEQFLGTRRIQNVMRLRGGIMWRPLLFAIFNRVLEDQVGELRESKIKELLKPERGGHLAFRVIDQEGNTPLHRAASIVENPEFMRYLLDHGARGALMIPNHQGQFPVDVARAEIFDVLADAMPGAPDPDVIQPFVPEEEIDGPMVEGEEPVVLPDGPLYKGYTKGDVEALNSFFDEPSEWVTCPVCLDFVRREDGCMYLLGHVCRPEHRNEKLYQLYKSPVGRILFCTVCGRVCNNDTQNHHRHHVLSDGTENARVKFAPMAPGASVFGNDCTTNGGGGVKEKIHRFHRLLNLACQFQEEVGKTSHKQIKNRLIAEVWKAPSFYVHNPMGILERKRFDYPCEFPVGEALLAAPAGFPDIPSPNPPPVKHEGGDATCFVNLGDVHDEDPGRPSYSMPHKVGAEIKDHAGQKVCPRDLVEALLAGENSGRCPFDPPCEGLVHPADLKIVLESITESQLPPPLPGQPPRILEDWKREKYENFYTSFYTSHPEFRNPGPGAGLAAAGAGPGQAGGANEPTLSLLSQMTDGVCELRPKGGRHKTYRRKQKGKTKKNARK